MYVCSHVHSRRRTADRIFRERDLKTKKNSGLRRAPPFWAAYNGGPAHPAAMELGATAGPRLRCQSIGPVRHARGQSRRGHEPSSPCCGTGEILRVSARTKCPHFILPKSRATRGLLVGGHDPTRWWPQQRPRAAPSWTSSLRWNDQSARLQRGLGIASGAGHWDHDPHGTWPPLRECLRQPRTRSKAPNRRTARPRDLIGS